MSSSHPLPVDETDDAVDERPGFVRKEYLCGIWGAKCTESGFLILRLACHFDGVSVCFVGSLLEFDGVDEDLVGCWK